MTRFIEILEEFYHEFEPHEKFLTELLCFSYAPSKAVQFFHFYIYFFNP
jgi:hypothetical protein